MGGYFGLGTTLRLGRRTGVEAVTANAGTDVATECRNPAAGTSTVEGVLTRDAGKDTGAGTEGRNVGTGSFDVTAGVAVVVDAAIFVGDAGAAAGAATVLALVGTGAGEGERARSIFGFAGLDGRVLAGWPPISCRSHNTARGYNAIKACSRACSPPRYASS